MYWKDSKNIFEKNSEKVHMFKGVSLAAIKVVGPWTSKTIKIIFMVFFYKNIHSHKFVFFSCLSIACQNIWS